MRRAHGTASRCSGWRALQGGMGVRRQLLRNHPNYVIQILQYLIVPESNYFEAMRFENRCSMHIANCVIRMVPAVDLDHRFLLNAYKAGKVSINSMLAPKFHAELTAAESVPELALGIGHRRTQRSGACCLRWRYPLHSTPILAFPLPGGRD